MITYASWRLPSQVCIDPTCAFLLSTCSRLTAQHPTADYKVQGRTLDKLVLSIGDRPFEPHLSLTSLYVLASRVRKRDHLRVLHWDPSTDAPRLRALRHCPQLALWHAGYDNHLWSTTTVRNAAALARSESQAGGNPRPAQRARGLQRGHNVVTSSAKKPRCQ